MARPRATSLRTNSGVTKSGTEAPKLSPSAGAACGAIEHLLAAEILALGDVDHLLGDDAGARPFELGHGLAVERPQWPVRVGEVAGEMLAGDVAVVDRLDRAAFIFLDAAALAHPFDAGAGKPLLDVDSDIGIRIGAGRIVDRHRRSRGASVSVISRSGTRRSGAASGRA